MWWRFYWWSIGPAACLFVEGLLPFELYIWFYRPVFWLRDHYEPFARDVALCLELCLWLYSTIRSLPWKGG